MAPRKTPGSSLATFAESEFVDPRLAALAQIPIIDKDSVIERESSIEDRTIALLEGDGFANAAAAYNALFGVFGMARYADKAQLAEDRTRFRIQQIVMVKAGAFNKRDDNWALRSVTEDGEVVVITLDRNEGRDKFLFYAAAAMAKYPNEPTPWCALQRIEKSDETHFYLIVPAGDPGSRPRIVGKAEHYDADFVGNV